MRIALRTGATIDDDTRCSFNRTALGRGRVGEHARPAHGADAVHPDPAQVGLARPPVAVGVEMAADDAEAHPAVQVHPHGALVGRQGVAPKRAATGERPAEGRIPLLREQFRRSVAALHRRVRLHHPERHPLPLGPWLCLPGAAPGGALEAMDRREQHGRRHLLQRLPIRLDEDGARRARHPRGVDAPGGRERSLAPDEFKARYEQFLVEAQAHL